MIKPSKADRRAAVQAHYGKPEGGMTPVPAYIESWVQTGMGHGLPVTARVISEVRRQAQRLAYCEALEMLGGDGHFYASGAGKDRSIASVAQALKDHVAEIEQQAANDVRRRG